MISDPFRDEDDMNDQEIEEVDAKFVSGFVRARMPSSA